MSDQLNLPRRYSADLVVPPGRDFRPGHYRGAWPVPPRGSAAMTATTSEHSTIPGGTSAADAAGGLGFSDLPRLGLGRRLVQMVDRAGDVLATQGRLRGLLRANALVAGDLSFPVVLRQIVSAARD